MSLTGILRTHKDEPIASGDIDHFRRGLFADVCRDGGMKVEAILLDEHEMLRTQSVEPSAWTFTYSEHSRMHCVPS
jgi:hypothetical protein